MILEYLNRKTKIDAPDALHLIARGVEQKEIFKDGPDRDYFSDRHGVTVFWSKKKVIHNECSPLSP